MLPPRGPRLVLTGWQQGSWAGHGQGMGGGGRRRRRCGPCGCWLGAVDARGSWRGAAGRSRSRALKLRAPSLQSMHKKQTWYMARPSCSSLICVNCAAKDACSCAVTCAVSAAAHEGNPGWSFSMVSEPFSERFGSPSVGRWPCRFPSSDMARLWAQPFFIRDRWRLKEVGPHL